MKPQKISEAVPASTYDLDRSIGVPNLLEVLDGIEFPASKAALVDYAIDRDASEDILDQLMAMPEKDYRGMSDVSRHSQIIESLPGEENMWSSEPSRDIPGNGTSFHGHSTREGR